MRVVLILAALVVVGLAGCVSEEAGTPQEAASVAPSVDSPHRVEVRASLENASVESALPEAFQGPFEIASVLIGLGGAEPNIGVTPSGAVFATAYETIVRSTDNGTTWEPVYEQTIGVTSDPMLWVDQDTGRVFSPQMFPPLACSNNIWSDDDGETWLETPMACGLPVVDHQKVATGPYPAGSPLGENPAYPNLVSYCYNKLEGTHCAISHNGGVSYPVDVLVDTSPLASPVDAPTGPQCGGLNGHQHHADDGTIYLPYGYNCGRAHIAVSKDGGITWEAIALHQPMMSLDPEVASTPDGSVYYFHRNGDHRMQLLRSTDDFATHDGPFQVSPPDVTATMFAGMTAGSDGRIVTAYLGSRDYSGLPDDAPDDARWHLFVSMSVDAGAEDPTFVTVQVTPDEDPVQVGSICMHKGCTGGNRNLLDFIDLHAGTDGRFYVAYADGCTDGCAGKADASAADSRDDQLAIASLRAGPSLVEDVGRFDVS